MSDSLAPLQLLQLKGFTPEELAVHNQNLTLLTNRVNALSGNGGPVTMKAGIDLAGSNVSGSGTPQKPGDLVSHEFAQSQYSPEAIAPHLEAGGKAALKSVRRIGDKAQKEPNSTFLNNVMNTSPTTNTATVAFDPPSGGGVTIHVSSGVHQYVDNQTVVPFSSRTDTVSLPASYTIGLITRAAGIVTATLGVNNVKPGQLLSIAGVTDSSFDGSFEVISTPTSTTATWKQVGGNASSSGGTAALGGCYYYFLKTQSTTLSLDGPFSADSQQNRLSVNVDGQVLIAVAVINSSGGDTTASAGGATPTVATAGNPILTRL